VPIAPLSTSAPSDTAPSAPGGNLFDQFVKPVTTRPPASSLDPRKQAGEARLPKTYGARSVDPGFMLKSPKHDVDPGFTLKSPERNVDPGFTLRSKQPKLTLDTDVGKSRPVEVTAAPARRASKVDVPPPPPSTVFTTPQQQSAFQSVGHLGGGGGGSGVIVANKGNQYMMLTNEHCVSSRTKVGDTVSVTLADGKKVNGKVAALGGFRKEQGGHDLAAITFTSRQPLKVAKLSKGEPAAGQAMFSIGYPYSGAGTKAQQPIERVDRKSGAIVADGKVTANRRDGQGQIDGEYGLVSTSRVIQGMSGGGMFNAKSGELIGINGQSAQPIVPPSVQDGKSFEQTVGPQGRSVGIAAAEVRQFLADNKAKLPDWGAKL
jgi:hypothetical protein